MKQINTVSIALKPNVYSTFRNLNNTVSNTLGEYVDNAVQSYLNNRELLLSVEPDYRLRITIAVNWERKSIVIEDNAAGIDTDNYERAFEPAHVPIDDTGLNEFGMGMKTASVWLANKWRVYTKALGESMQRYTEFDLHKVTTEGREELLVTETPMPIEAHFTRIELTELSNHAPTSNQMDKVRRHLSSIYRKFLRSGEVEIKVNDVKLEAPCFDILNVPYYKTPKGNSILWKKDVNFEAGEYKARGFIAILDKIQNNANGLVLMRRGRVIVGGGDERYFPLVIFGSPGNFRYKRLFGELELEGFEVTFNKNGFRDEEDLYAFMEALRDELRNDGFNLLGQADNYRQRDREQHSDIAKNVTKALNKESKPKQLTRLVQETENKINDQQHIMQSEQLIQQAERLGGNSESFTLGKELYTLNIELVSENDSDSIYSVTMGDVDSNEKTLFDAMESKLVTCKINIAHPFFTRFDQFKKGNDYMPIISVFKALTLAELMAPNYGVQSASKLRLLFNQNLMQ